MANPFIEQLTETASGGTSAVPEVMASPIGSYIYFIIALIIVFLIVGVTIGVIKWGKKELGQKKKGRYRRRN